jgi:hypothetical protein
MSILVIVFCSRQHSVTLLNFGDFCIFTFGNYTQILLDKAVIGRNRLKLFRKFDPRDFLL